MNHEEFREWCAKNAIGNKLRAAIENIEVGKGWDMFNGLETGETLIKVVYSGPVISIEPYKKEKTGGIPGFEKSPETPNKNAARVTLVPESKTEPEKALETQKPNLKKKLDELAKRLHEGWITVEQYKNERADLEAKQVDLETEDQAENIGKNTDKSANMDLEAKKVDLEAKPEKPLKRKK